MEQRNENEKVESSNNIYSRLLSDVVNDENDNIDENLLEYKKKVVEPQEFDFDAFYFD